MKKIKIVFP